MKTYPAIKDLVPHRPPMLFLDHVLEFTPIRLTAAYRVPHRQWYGLHGLPAFMGIELIAQAIAAHNSLLSRQQDASATPALGVLLGTRRYDSTVPRFAPDEELTVVVEEKMQDPSGFGAYVGVILSPRSSKLASATVKVFRPPDFHAYMTSQRPS